MPNTVPDGLQTIDGTLVNQMLQSLFKYQNGITALAGGGLAGAPVLSAGLSLVETVATANDSVALPSATPDPKKDGKSIVIYLVGNSGAQSLNVFPQSTDKINAGAAGAAFAVDSGKNVLFFCPKQGVWRAILTA